jgi:hypothetical protein
MNPRCQTSACLFRVYMIFAIGAVGLYRSSLHEVSPMDYYAAAMIYADKALELRGLQQIQALLLILIFSLQHDVSGTFQILPRGSSYWEEESNGDAQLGINGTWHALRCVPLSKTVSTRVTEPFPRWTNRCAVGCSGLATSTTAIAAPFWEDLYLFRMKTSRLKFVNPTSLYLAQFLLTFPASHRR